jgi:hypothetical protein
MNRLISTWSIPRRVRLFTLLPLVAITAAVPVIVIDVTSGQASGLSSAFFLVWCSLVVWFWYRLALTTFRIDAMADELVFHRLSGSVTLRPAEVAEIRSQAFWNGYVYVVRSSSRPILIPYMLPGLHDFVHYVRKANPQVHVVGL